MTAKTGTNEPQMAEVAEVIPPAGQTTPGSDLATTETAVALIADDEWTGVDDGDLSPAAGGGLVPFMALNRKVDGGFAHEETGEVTDTIDFVWMAKTRSRAWWPEAFGKGDKAPQCRSNDGIVPTENSPAKQAETCASCPHSQWGEDGTPPACNESIEALVFLQDGLSAGRLARLRFGGMAFGPARRYWDSFSLRLPKRPPIAYITQAHLEAEDTPNGKFLVPQFSRVRELTREEAQPIIDERTRRTEAWQEAIATDVATGRGVDTSSENKGDPFSQAKADWNARQGGGAPAGEQPFTDADKYQAGEEPFDDTGDF